MEKMSLIRNELISIPYQFKCRFSWVPPIEEIAEVLCSLLKIFRF
jgi:hypothetical protein